MPVEKFEYKHWVLHVVCGKDSSAVIVERLPEEKRDKNIDGMRKKNGETWKPEKWK